MIPVDALLTAAPEYPRRVVCLTEETTETLYRIGAGDLVVGVSCFTLRPDEARSKPKISSFLDAKLDEIVALRPDLVVGFSDLQRDIARDLAARSVPVLVMNQRSVAEVLQAIRVTAAIVGRADAGAALASSLADRLRAIAARAATLPRRPKVFFEEWPDPLLCGIRWVSELIEIAGGVDVCADRRAGALAKERMVDAAAIAAADPDVVVASWCGKTARRATIAQRPGWERVRAVVDDQLYEMKSTVILQPGPAALTDGVDQLAAIVAAVARGERLPTDARTGLRRADAPGSAIDEDADELVRRRGA